MSTPCTFGFIRPGALALACMLISIECYGDSASSEIERQNKDLARNFYEDLWFSRSTDRYEDYLAETYVVHDIGDEKNLTEPAVTQKEIADFFWANGNMSGAIDYQIADGDLVATRWTWQFEPTTMLGRILKGRDDLPIINVFRIKDGEIVEIWNHRHDIDTGMPIRFIAKGFLFGILVTVIPLAWAISLRRRLKRLQTA